MCWVECIVWIPFIVITESLVEFEKMRFVKKTKLNIGRRMTRLAWTGCVVRIIPVQRVLVLIIIVAVTVHPQFVLHCL